MSRFRRPALWAVVLAALLAVSISGVPPWEVDEGTRGSLTAQGPIAWGPFDEPAPEQLRTDAPAGEYGAGPVEDTAVLVASASEGAQPWEENGQLQVGGPTEEESRQFEAAAQWRIITYTVQPGETLSSVAARFNIAQETILAANDLANANFLRAGQKLNILSQDGAIHRVQRGESLWEIARMYRVDLEEIVRVNNITDPNRLLPAQEIIIPGRQAASIANAMRQERLVSADGTLLQAFSWPVNGRISSRYGMRWGAMHHGVDIAVNTGTPVRAAAAGRVSFAGWNGGYGYLVVIDHGQGVETRYAHNSRIVVKVGQQVKRGDIVAYSGNTGRSTGPHLHFEIRYRGASVDPLKYLR